MITNPPVPPKYVYQIYNSATGLWSRGGQDAEDGTPGYHWGKLKGAKVWKSAGHVKLHLRQFSKIPLTWIVYEYKLLGEEYCEYSQCQATDFNS